MNAARVRIGRVRMKAGGADVRVLDSGRRNDGVLPEIREFARSCHADPPSSFVALAFYPSRAGEHHRPPYRVRWQTCDPDMPLPRLMLHAAAQLSVRAAVDIAVHEASGGHEPDDGSA